MATTDALPSFTTRFQEIQAKFNAMEEENMRIRKELERLTEDVEDLKRDKGSLKEDIGQLVERELERERKEKEDTRSLLNVSQEGLMRVSANLPGLENPTLEVDGDGLKAQASMSGGDPHSELLFQSAMMFGLSDASVLTGLCHKHDGSWHISEVDLDRFIANMWGSFVAGGSAFTRSSRNLRLEFQDEMNALTLSGELSDGKGTWKASQIDLAEYVVVKNGRLTFEKRTQQRSNTWLSGPIPLSAHESLVATAIAKLESDCEWRSLLAQISDPHILLQYAEATFGRPLTEILVSMLGDGDTGSVARQHAGHWFSRNGDLLVGTIITKAVNNPCGQGILNGVWSYAPWVGALKALPEKPLSTEISRKVAEIMKGNQTHLKEWIQVQEDVNAK